MHTTSPTFFQNVMHRFWERTHAKIALIIFFLFVLMAIYAPLLASSKPLVVQYKGEWYFPLFRYLFYQGFYTKPLDLFYNVLMLTFPLFIFSFYRKKMIYLSVILQFLLFFFFLFFPLKDPAFYLRSNSGNDWNQEIQEMSSYSRLNEQLNYARYFLEQQQLAPLTENYQLLINKKDPLPTLWTLHFERHLERPYVKEKKRWLQERENELHYKVMPLITSFHWEEDAGGDAYFNQLVDWTHVTRVNRKNLAAGLIFGTRISLSVGLVAVGIALLIGIPIGAYAGFYGKTVDLIVYRLIEIWESMPAFFMLLMIVAVLQAKSIFLVIFTIGLFGWTNFSRFIRGEYLRQKQLPYIEACRALGYGNQTIIFKHLLPNAMSPVITLIPFSIMGAITSEAALSFLGLGEESSNSWGVLMEEARTVFPSESYLLWPPALFLSLLLVSIAIIGDSLRDALDPKIENF